MPDVRTSPGKEKIMDLVKYIQDELFKFDPEEQNDIIHGIIVAVMDNREQASRTFKQSAKLLDNANDEMVSALDSLLKNVYDMRQVRK